MRLIFASVVLCSTIFPGLTSEFHPELGSFAYPISHSSPVFEFDFAAAQPPPVSVTSGPAASADRPPLYTKSELCNTVAFEAATNKLPVRFFANLIEQESGFRSHVVSFAGARGIAQFMPRTAAEQGLIDPFDPMLALSASAKFVANLRDRFGNLGLAAAAYNAGPQRVSDWLSKQGGLPTETQNYVRRITGLAVEEWARSDTKGQENRLPPYAECPQLRLASADPLVNTRMVSSTSESFPRRSGKAAARYARSIKYANFRGSALKYVSLSPSVAKAARTEGDTNRVRLAGVSTSSH